MEHFALPKPTYGSLRYTAPGIPAHGSQPIHRDVASGIILAGTSDVFVQREVGEHEFTHIISIKRVEGKFKVYCPILGDLPNVDVTFDEKWKAVTAAERWLMGMISTEEINRGEGFE